jgi:hypothetical protein
MRTAASGCQDLLSLFLTALELIAQTTGCSFSSALARDLTYDWCH